MEWQNVLALAVYCGVSGFFLLAFMFAQSFPNPNERFINRLPEIVGVWLAAMVWPLWLPALLLAAGYDRVRNAR